MITRREFCKVAVASGFLASVGGIAGAKESVARVVPDPSYCHEEGRSIPMLSKTDLIVVGGSSRAVAAAAAAARGGLKVFLLASMPYLGDDICGSLLYDTRKGERIRTPLAQKVFGGEGDFRPLYVKTVLEDQLIDNGIDFLYSTFVTNVSVDVSGNICGVVIANRSGRQAIQCKGIIDATQEAAVARMAGVKFIGNEGDEMDFYYTVAGNGLKESVHISGRESLKRPIRFNGKEYPVTRYRFRAALEAPRYPSLMRLEQLARTVTWDPDQVDSSDLLWYIPSWYIKSSVTLSLTDDQQVTDFPVEVFAPEKYNNLWVLGPCAGIPREAADSAMRPANAMFLGEMLGNKVTSVLSGLPEQRPDRVLVTKKLAEDYGRISEVLAPLRPAYMKGGLLSPDGSIPLLGEYDVVVLGGGTAGAVAGISAAGQGVRTLMLEYLHGLGGIATMGMIGRYWDGFREGYTGIIDKGVREMAPPAHPRQMGKADFVSDWKMEWYRREFLKAGGELWFGVLGCGVIVEKNRARGLVVATPAGRFAILTKVLIDSTGSADMAIAAGAGFEYTGKNTIAVQGAGTGKRNPEDHYNNNDWSFIDDTDIMDVTRTFVQAKVKLRNEYDMVKIPQTRERRRVIGEYVISVYDVLNHRRYPDTISYHRSSFDTHGMVVDPFFILSPPLRNRTKYDADVPLRALLPKGIEGIITTGLGASAHRDAMPVIRMQPCLQNQGYAVGYLAARSVKEGKTLRKIDIRKIQRHLVEIGNLPERVLTDVEFRGFSKMEMKHAAERLTDGYKGLEVLLTDPVQCKKLVGDRMDRTATGNREEITVLSSVLCMLGSSKAVRQLQGIVASCPQWDKGWHYRGMGQFGMSLSRLDALIIALGHGGDSTVLPVIWEKARQLRPDDAFSHFRAVCMAMESIKSEASVPVLAEMLSLPGIGMHALSDYRDARSRTVPGVADTSTRNWSLKELHIARALYLCGDDDVHSGRKTLVRYASGVQGHYARYAYEVMNMGKSGKDS